MKNIILVTLVCIFCMGMFRTCNKNLDAPSVSHIMNKVLNKKIKKNNDYFWSLLTPSKINSEDIGIENKNGLAFSLSSMKTILILFNGKLELLDMQKKHNIQINEKFPLKNKFIIKGNAKIYKHKYNLFVNIDLLLQKAKQPISFIVFYSEFYDGVILYKKSTEFINKNNIFDNHIESVDIYNHKIIKQSCDVKDFMYK